MNRQAENKLPLSLRLLAMGNSYFVKTPGWLKKLYPRRTWDKGKLSKTIYLSFDDGPESSITPFVLDALKKYDAKATFFCIGQNVVNNPSLFKQITGEGHRIGNHTMKHLNGWRTEDEDYLSDINEAAQYIRTDLFRPPYGRIRSSQARKLKKLYPDMKIIMWDVLSGDFDESCSAEKCLENVTRYAGPGSIVVFHDSIKAGEKLRQVLPGTLDYFSRKGYRFEAI